MYESKRQYQYGTGRRKSSIARVRLYQGGTGSITINGRDIDDYFGLDTLKMVVRQPLATTDMLGKVDLVCTVEGGGVTGQAGAITINGRDIDDYFGLDTLKMVVRQPLAATDLLGKVDLVCTVEGGGVTGQAGAIRHGVARALLGVNPELRATLKAAGFLTRDPRMKERKKYGLKAARRAPQFSKR